MSDQVRTERLKSPSVPVTIAASGTESTVAEISRFINATLMLPSGWDTQTISFQGSQDNSTFVPVYDKDGVLVSIAGAVASRGYEVHAAVMNFQYVKVVSGVAQGDAVTLTFACAS